MSLDEKLIVQQLTGVASQSEISLNEEGWTSRVYIVGNGKYVVKFPRRDEVKAEYKQEIALYNLLSGFRTSVQVPKLCWVDPNNDYLGYEGIVGVAFDQTILPAKALTSIGHELGQFLRQLHLLKLKGARTLTIEDEIDELQSKFKLIKKPEAYFNASELEALEKLISEVLPRKLHQLGFDPALCHGDLGYWNLILKEDNHVGIIDFGDIGYWDRSKDFIGLEHGEVLAAALKAYGDYPNLTKKINIRAKVLAVLDLHFYIDTENAEGIAKTVKKIRQFI